MVTAINEQIAQMQSATNAVNYENNKDNVGNTSLDNNAFLQLMMQQLKYQDPTNPMDNTEFLTQQAQFTQLEQLQSLNDNISSLSNNMSQSNSLILAQNEVTQAASMIGQEVKATDPDDEENTIQGKIDEVKFSDEGIKFIINGKEVSASSITSITKAANDSSSTTTSESDS